MRNNTFEHLQGLCAGKRIVCERNGSKINLTTPNGAVNAECESLAEAFDTLRNDPTFASLPIVLAKPAPELYDYEFRSQSIVLHRKQAQTLNEACEQLRPGKPFRPVASFHMMAVVEFTDGETWGVTWKRL